MTLTADFATGINEEIPGVGQTVTEDKDLGAGFVALEPGRACTGRVPGEQHQRRKKRERLPSEGN